MLDVNLTVAVAEALQNPVRQLAACGVSDPYGPVTSGLFESGQPYDMAALVVVTILVLGLGSLAAGAGIGGGGLFVPIYAAALGLGVKGAVPLSKATILGAAIGNFASIAVARHPDPTMNKPLIDYEACVFMQSGELLGVVFGVILNVLLPEVLIIIFLFVLLFFNAYKTIQKGVQKYKAETKKMEQEKEKQAAKGGNTLPPNTIGAAADDDMPKQNRSTTSFKSEDTEFSRRAESQEPVAPPVGGVDIDNAAKLQEIEKQDSVQFPMWAYSILLPMTAYTIAWKCVQEPVGPLGACEPVSYWAWYLSAVPVLCGFTVLAAVILKRRHAHKLANKYQFRGAGEEHPPYKELMWDNKTLKQFPAVAILAGLAAGLLGIGGGMVIGPLFIQLDMQPKVGSSSCAFMILWTAISGVIQYYMMGKIGYQFIIFGIVIGFVSGQIGQQLVDGVLKKTGRPSYVVFLLGSIVGVACLSMTVYGIVKMTNNVATCPDYPIFAFDTKMFECKT